MMTKQKIDIPDSILNHLKKDFEINYKNFEKLNEMVSKLFEKEEGTIGRVLKCHLVIEKYLNDLLNFHLGPKLDLEKVRLSFNQKLFILEGISDEFFIYGKGIREINSLRNRIAHRLDYDINESNLDTCETFAKFLSQNQNLKKIEIVEIFSYNVCVLIAESMTEYSQRRRQELKELIEQTTHNKT